MIECSAKLQLTPAPLHRYKLHSVIQFLDREVAQEVKSIPWQVNDRVASRVGS